MYDVVLLPAWLFINALGTPIIFLLLVAGLSLFVWFCRRNDVVPFLLTIVVTLITVNLLKVLSEIPRPDTALVHLESYRFPSTHAAMAAALAGSFWWYLIKTTESKPLRTLITLSSAGVIVVVSHSRIALNVHVPVDVITGAAIGFLTAFCVHALFYRLR